MRHENSNHVIVQSETNSKEITLNNHTLSEAELDRQSPRPSAFYIVHTPSQSFSTSWKDNEEKTKNLNPPQSPLGSPHSNHSDSFRAPRRSSFSRFFESLNNLRHGHSRRPSKNEFLDNEEKGFLYGHDDHDSHHHGYSHRRYFFVFVVGFVVLFSFFSLILWIVSCHQKPTVVLKSIRFHEFYIQANGVDSRGCLTSTLSTNSSVKLNFRNTGTFFGVHVTSISLDLHYYQLPLATGNIPMFYQSKNSKRSIKGVVKANQIPLYGVGSNIMTSDKQNGLPVEPVPLKLSVIVRSKAYVVGWFVTNKFYKKIECAFIMESKKIEVPISLANKCK